MRIVICGNYGISNLGDEAILHSLKALILRNFPEAEIEVMGKGKLFPLGLRSFFTALFAPEKFITPLRIIKSCDFFILGGGGLFTDEERLFVPFFWAFNGFIAHLFKRPLLCIGISVGPLNAVNKWIINKLFKRAKLITVRDEASYNYAKKSGSEVYLSSDLAVLLENNCEQKENEKKYIVISARPFKKNNKVLYTKLAQFCDFVVINYGLYIRLMPFQQDGINDVLILNKIFEQVEHKKHIFIDQSCKDITTLIEILKNAEVVIGMRLHASILSLVAGTPFLPFVYMNKVSDFWHEFAEIHTLNIENISIDELINLFQKIYNNRRERRAGLSLIKNKLAIRAKVTEKMLIQTLASIQK